MRVNTRIINIQVINPHVIEDFITTNKYFVRPLFPEKALSDTSKGGRPRCGQQWVIVILCVFSRLENIPWRQLPKKLSLCDFLIEAGYLAYIPSKSKFHQVWHDINRSSLQSWIRQLGYEVAILQDCSCAMDSSGFKIITGQLWRYAKYASATISKTSKAFRKVHIIVGLPSRAIVSIANSASKTHDSQLCGKLFKKLSKRLVPQLKRMFADKGYWDEKIMGWITQEGMYPVIPPKSNSVDHGSSSPHDLIVRAHQKYPGLYKHNHQPGKRAGVEHVFGLIKLRPMILYDRKLRIKEKSLLCSFLWYNYQLYAQTLRM